MKNVNPDTHIYLYAKNWYKVTDEVKDLKIIIGYRNGVRPEHISIGDIQDILLEIVHKDYSEQLKNEYLFKGFVYSCANRGVIEGCLSVMQCMKVTGLNLGEPDYSILPSGEK